MLYSIIWSFCDMKKGNKVVEERGEFKDSLSNSLI